MAYQLKLAFSGYKLLYIIFKYHKKYYSTNILGTPLLSSEASIFIPKENGGDIPLVLAINTKPPERTYRIYSPTEMIETLTFFLYIPRFHKTKFC